MGRTADLDEPLTSVVVAIELLAKRDEGTKDGGPGVVVVVGDGHGGGGGRKTGTGWGWGSIAVGS